MGINWDIFRYMVSDVLVDVFLYIICIYIYICFYIYIYIHMYYTCHFSHVRFGHLKHLHVSTSPICMVIQMAERRKPKMLPLQA